MRLKNYKTTVENLKNIPNYYFLGIGGIGMSALARYFKLSGKNVAGYDRVRTSLTDELEKEGIPVHYEDDTSLIPPSFMSQNNTIVVFTPAIPANHSELNWFRNQGFPIAKRSEVLGLISKEYKTIAVAGTHGKTTVSTMIAHIMWSAPVGCNAFLGGISKNFNSNLAVNTSSEWVVTEADEFDRSFHQLFPYAAVITAIDPDHLDIYGNTAALNEAFIKFAGQIKSDGIALVKKELPLKKEGLPERSFTYSLQGDTDFYAEDIRLANGRYHFNLAGPDFRINDISLEHPGLVNVENAVAAAALTWLIGIHPDHIKKALYNFSGIRRRFDIKINSDQITYIDDYAHHPAEIEATLKSVRELYPRRKITGIFQPHLFSRTRDLAEEFARSLNQLDRLILLDIYPARELPIEGITSASIFKHVNISDRIMCKKEELPALLNSLDVEVLVTLGAGDIDKMVDPITQILAKKAKA